MKKLQEILRGLFGEDGVPSQFLEPQGVSCFPGQPQALALCDR